MTIAFEEKSIRTLAREAPRHAGLLSDPVAASVYGRLEAPADDRCFIDADGRTVPPLSTLATVFRRAALTTGPIILADAAALALAGVVTQGALGFAYPSAAEIVGWKAAAVALLPLLVVHWLSALYAEVWTHVVVEFRQLTRAATLGLAAAAVGALSAPPLAVWILAAWLPCVILTPLLRVLAHAWCSSRSWWGYPTLIIGSGAGAGEIVRALLAAPRSGLRPILVNDPIGECRTAVVPVVNDSASLESILRTEAVHHAVISLPDLSNRRLGELVDRYSRLVPHLLILSDCSTLPMLWSATRNGGRLSGIEVRNGLLLGTLLAFKRTCDIVVAGVGLLIGLPLMLLIAGLVKLSGPGPVFYLHTRIGRRGRPFKACKFRTMHVNGDEILRGHLADFAAARDEWESARKLRRDPRVTAIGRFLRVTSLDELPQLWNVLSGEMSLVGPRPIVESEIAYYGAVFKLYTTAKPGITGLWQVSGRNDIGYDERVKLDEFYVRHWSPWLDVYILAKTVSALLQRRGAY